MQSNSPYSGDQTFGRPTDYKPEYCEKVIQLAATGMPKVKIACELGVSRETMWRWSCEHPDFRNAIKACEQAFEGAWIELGVNAAHGKIEKFNPAAYAIIAKNCCGWGDKHTDRKQTFSLPLTLENLPELSNRGELTSEQYQHYSHALGGCLQEIEVKATLADLKKTQLEEILELRKENAALKQAVKPQ